MIFYPKRETQAPALIVELKWDKTKDTAVEQMKEKKYVRALKDFRGEVLLVGINYDKTTREHSCLIEKAM